MMREYPTSSALLHLAVAVAVRTFFFRESRPRFSMPDDAAAPSASASPPTPPVRPRTKAGNGRDWGGG
jgi:hypothetical protein